jgi:hypothetical protein
MPSSRDSFRRNRVAPVGSSILARPRSLTRSPADAPTDALVAQHVSHVVDLFVEQIELSGGRLSLRLRAAVDIEVQLAADTIFLSWRLGLILITGAWIAASIERNRFSKMKRGMGATPCRAELR